MAFGSMISIRRLCHNVFAYCAVNMNKLFNRSRHRFHLRLRLSHLRLLLVIARHRFLNQRRCYRFCGCSGLDLIPKHSHQLHCRLVLYLLAIRASGARFYVSMCGCRAGSIKNQPDNHTCHSTACPKPRLRPGRS